MRGFTEAVRTELLAEGSAVRVTEVHLPAINTPQFGWCLNRLPKHPQPVPPDLRPRGRRVPHPRRRPRAPRARRSSAAFNRLLVLANKLAPGVIDHYVARTSIDSQQTD